MRKNENQKIKLEVLGMKNKKGITLIALIITIIVSLILARYFIKCDNSGMMGLLQMHRMLI